MLKLLKKIEQWGHAWSADKPPLVKNATTWVYHTLVHLVIIILASPILWVLSFLIPRITDPILMAHIGASTFYIVREIIQHRDAWWEIFTRLDPLMDWLTPVIFNGVLVLSLPLVVELVRGLF